jgi:hypothetical protein
MPAVARAVFLMKVLRFIWDFLEVWNLKLEAFR